MKACILTIGLIPQTTLHPARPSEAGLLAVYLNGIGRIRIRLYTNSYYNMVGIESASPVSGPLLTLHYNAGGYEHYSPREIVKDRQAV